MNDLRNKDSRDAMNRAVYFDRDAYFIGYINELRDIVGLKHIITTKASSIHK